VNEALAVSESLFLLFRSQFHNPSSPLLNKLPTRYLSSTLRRMVRSDFTFINIRHQWHEKNFGSANRSFCFFDHNFIIHHHLCSTNFLLGIYRVRCVEWSGQISLSLTFVTNGTKKTLAQRIAPSLKPQSPLSLPPLRSTTTLQSLRDSRSHRTQTTSKTRYYLLVPHP
jgi:hypothetical protein